MLESLKKKDEKLDKSISLEERQVYYQSRLWISNADNLRMLILQNDHVSKWQETSGKKKVSN